MILHQNPQFVLDEHRRRVTAVGTTPPTDTLPDRRLTHTTTARDG